MNLDNRDSFVFYRSFYEAMEDLNDTEQLEIYKAITSYALNGLEPELSGYVKAIFRLIRPLIDANHKKWVNGKKGAEYGKLGGRPKNNPTETPTEPLNNPTETATEPPMYYEDVNVDVLNIVESVDSPSELSFENVWDLYQKKGNRKSSLAKWGNLSLINKKQALKSIPLYITATPDKQYRKDFEKYLKMEVWSDEIIINTPTTNESANPAYRPL